MVYSSSHRTPIANQPATTDVPDFSTRLLQWYDRHGRKDLPWQQSRDAYRIWLSEIMLQQTQVATVVPYFERFVARFPTVDALAAGHLDEVLHLWTGLGYYARARNLYAAARIIRDRYGGRFPSDPDEARGLPGIGRSTAHAILCFAFGRTLPILDGNVKRVLARHHRLHGWPGRASTDRELWRLAAAATPAERTADYNQAIMDLGATVCVRRKPLCRSCPVAAGCRARVAGEQERLPTPAPKRVKPVRAVTLVMLRSDSAVLLERRPPDGIWGGLWSFPEVEDGDDARRQIFARFGVEMEGEERWAVMRHSFTHYHLDITPLSACLKRAHPRVMENPGLVWYNPKAPDARGLAAPVKKLLNRLG